MSKLDSPSAERNKYPIWKVLESKVAPTLSEGAQILEIASGAGVHTQFFSMQLMQLRRSTFKWYPSDTSESYMASTRAYVQDDPTLTDDIVVTPTKLTLNEYGIVEVETVNLFADLTFDLILNINMIHISPWEATLGLMNVAGEKLRPGGFLFLYGPYKVGGTCVESNRYVILCLCSESGVVYRKHGFYCSRFRNDSGTLHSLATFIIVTLMCLSDKEIRSGAFVIWRR